MRIRLFPEHSTEFTSQENLYNYLYGGKGIVKLVSPTGVSHIYSYEKPRNAEDFAEDVIFVFAVHCAKDNPESYTKFYLGMIEDDKFRITRNSRFGENTPIVKGVRCIEKLRKYQQYLDASPMHIYHEGVCGLCGSKIWAKKSCECGFGRYCRKEMKLPNFNLLDE